MTHEELLKRIDDLEIQVQCMRNIVNIFYVKPVEHPTQPIVCVRNVHRFKQNTIVRYLLDHGGIDMNKIVTLQFPVEDYEQFCQLIGYSVCGYTELEGVRDKTKAKAEQLSSDLARENKSTGGHITP